MNHFRPVSKFPLFVVLMVGLAGLARWSAAGADVYQTEADILYRDAAAAASDEYIAERCRLDVYYPVGTEDFTTVVWFHGGNLEGGERFIPRSLRDQGIAVVTATYRFSPRVSCPAYIEDAAAAVAWVFANIERFGGDPDRIFVSGHSAGGYLVAMIGLDQRWLGAHGVDANRIAGLLPFSGQTVTHSTVRKERGIPATRPLIDEFSPLAHARADSPPLILITGDRNLDAPARYEENAYLQRVMQQAGHQRTELYELAGFNHGSMVEPACYLLLQHIRAATSAAP